MFPCHTGLRDLGDVRGLGNRSRAHAGPGYRRAYAVRVHGHRRRGRACSYATSGHRGSARRPGQGGDGGAHAHRALSGATARRKRQRATAVPRPHHGLHLCRRPGTPAAGVSAGRCGRRGTCGGIAAWMGGRRRSRAGPGCEPRRVLRTVRPLRLIPDDGPIPSGRSPGSASSRSSGGQVPGARRVACAHPVNIVTPA